MGIHPTPIGVFRRLLDLLLIALIVVALGGVALGRLLPALGHPVYVVAGPSMIPSLALGSAVMLDRVAPASLAVGDVVTLETGPGRAVYTHRILRVVDRAGEVWLETKGDANPLPDPTLIPASAVIGRVTASLPAAGYLIALLSVPPGVMFVLSTGAILLVLGWWLESIESDRRRRSATAPASVPADRPPETPVLPLASAAPVAMATAGVSPGTPTTGLLGTAAARRTRARAAERRRALAAGRAAGPVRRPARRTIQPAGGGRS